MSEEKSSVVMDLRQDSALADCLDCLAALPAAVDRMRAQQDDSEIPGAMVEHTHQVFGSLGALSPDQAWAIAGGAQDHLYRYVTNLTVLDRYTRAYVGQAVRYFFLQLSGRGIKTYYVLDNALRADRLAAVLELFDLAGISTATPGRDGRDWDLLSRRIGLLIEHVGHVAYIEPDAETNHIQAARDLARRFACIGSFRNQAPDDPRIEPLATLRALDA